MSCHEELYLISATKVGKNPEFQCSMNSGMMALSEDFVRSVSEDNRYIVSATLDGKPYPYSTIRHEDILRGGTLVLHMGSEPGDWGREMAAQDIQGKFTGKLKCRPGQLP